MKIPGILVHLLALFSVAVWGSTFVSSRLLLDAGLSPELILVFRFLLAYAGIWALSPRRWFADNLADELWLVALAVTGGSLYFWTENTALRLAPASVVSFLVCTTPLVTTILAAVWAKVGKNSLAATMKQEPIGPRTWLGALVAVAGIALLVLNGSKASFGSSKGEWLALAASLCWAIYVLICRDLLDRYPSAFIVRKVFIYGILTILPFMIPQFGSFDWSLLARPLVWGNLLYLGLVASLFCFVAWNVALKRLGVVVSSNYNYLNPVFASVIAFFVLGERFTLQSGLGCLLVLAGVWWGGRKVSPTA